MSTEALFLDYSADKLAQLSARIGGCLDKLTPDQIWSRHAENENAAGNLVLHLAGNVRQWILHGIGGEPDTRARDTEFAARGGVAIEDLKLSLSSTVDQAAAVIRVLPIERLEDRITVQGHDVSVLEAIYHVVEHFSGHTGQIIFLTKFFTGEDLGFYGYLASKRHGVMTP